MYNSWSMHGLGQIIIYSCKMGGKLWFIQPTNVNVVLIGHKFAYLCSQLASNSSYSTHGILHYITLGLQVHISYQCLPILPLFLELVG